MGHLVSRRELFTVRSVPQLQLFIYVVNALAVGTVLTVEPEKQHKKTMKVKKQYTKISKLKLK